MVKQQSRASSEATAYHEAGHAVLSCVLGRPIRKVTVIAEDDFLGKVTGFSRPSLYRRLEVGQDGWKLAIPRMMILFGGPLAEEFFAGRRNRRGAGYDNDAISDIAISACGSSEEASCFVRWVETKTASVLRNPTNWAAVRHVAASLMAHGELGGEEVKRLCSEAMKDLTLQKNAQTHMDQLRRLKLAGRKARRVTNS